MGRKPALILGAIGMGICHIIVAIIYAKNEHQWDTHKAAGWACIVMVWLFVAHFGWSWGPWYVSLTWSCRVELTPPVHGSSLRRCGHFQLVRTALLLALRLTGELPAISRDVSTDSCCSEFHCLSHPALEGCSGCKQRRGRTGFTSLYGSFARLTDSGMNNFIVGQVTPDMISGMRYGRALTFYPFLAFTDSFQELSSCSAYSSSWALASCGGSCRRQNA
jgi:hypothetical protein